MRTYQGDQDCLPADTCMRGTEHKLVLITHIKGPGKDISLAKLCEQFVINLKEKKIKILLFLSKYFIFITGLIW